MNSPGHRPRTPPYGHGNRPRSSSPASLSPRALSPAAHSYTPPSGQPHYPSPPVPNLFTPPRYPPYPPPPRQYFTPPSHLPPSPLTNTSTPYGGTPPPPGASDQSRQASTPGSFYMHPDIPSPMVFPQQKRRRFTPIRGRMGRRHHRPRGGRGGGGGGRGRGEVGIDAYYDRFMFEDPWRDLLPQSGDKQEESECLNKQQNITDDDCGSAVSEDKSVSPQTGVSPQSQMCNDEGVPVT